MEFIVIGVPPDLAWTKYGQKSVLLSINIFSLAFLVDLEA